MENTTTEVTPRSLEQSGAKGWIFSKQVVGVLAKWACRQSPHGVPDDLPIVLFRFREELAASERFDTNDMASFGFRELEDFIRPMLFSIDQFKRWNISKFELDKGFTDAEDPNRPIKYSFSSRYDTPKAEYDFIDLDALIRNVAAECVRESLEAI